MPKKITEADLRPPTVAAARTRKAKDASRFERGETAPVLITQREVLDFLVEAPAGPVVVTYGATSHYGARDTFTARYRSQDIIASDLASIHRQIAAIEAEHQAKAEAAKVRREMAADPEPAYLFHPDSDPATEVCRTIKVRGIDQRSRGSLLIEIEQPNGDIERRSVKSRYVLRDLDRDEIRQLTVARREVAALVDAIKASEGVSWQEALDDVEIDLTVRIDPATGMRHADVDGRPYQGADDRELTDKIIRDLLLARGWTHRVDGPYRADTQVVALLPSDADAGDAAGSEESRGRRTSVDFAKLYRDEASAQAYLEAVEHHRAAAELLDALVQEYAFDTSMLLGAGTPDAQGASGGDSSAAVDEEKVHVPNVPAPAVDAMWDD